MKKIFVADQDEKFQAVMKSLCKKEKMDLHIYTSSMEILSHIEQESPDLVFLNLELPDIDDFVMFDLLKKADTLPPIPVLITYMPESEKELQNYKNLKFQPQGYHKKPIQEKEIQALLSMYLGGASLVENEAYKDKKESTGTVSNRESIPLIEEDDIIFSEVLAENDNEIDIENDNYNEDNPIEALIEEQKKPREAVFKVSNGSYVDMEERTAERERAARLISLEKQNHFLMTENKRLSAELKTFQEKPSQLEAEFKKRIDENKKNYGYLEKQIDELNSKLTDKERELIAKDHEFEKRLRHEMDEVIRETEERLRTDIGQFYDNELNIQKESYAKLQLEITALKEIETSSNISIARLDEEKAALSQKLNELENEKKSIMKKLMAMEIDLTDLEKEKEILKEEKEILQKEKEEKEKSFTAALERSTKELELNREELKDYQNKLDMVNDLLQKAFTLTRV